MVTHSKVADMNYDNYEEKVVQRLKVKLVGWPFEKIVSPAKLYTIGELRTLRDALRCGACSWVKLSKSELKVHADNITMRRTAGEVIGKTRKERSDKGVKSGPRRKRGAHDEESESDGESTSRTPADTTAVSSASLRTVPKKPEAGLSKKRKSASSADTLAGPSKKRKAAQRDHGVGPSKQRKAPAKPRAGKKSAKAQLPPSKETIGADTDEEVDE